MFIKAVTDAAEVTLGRWHGAYSEQWIVKLSCTLVNKRKEAKIKNSQALAPECTALPQAKYSELNKAMNQSCWKDKRKWIKNKAAEAEATSRKNDLWSLYKVVRDLTGRASNATVSIKSNYGRTLITKSEQNNRWVEHFQEVLNQPSLSKCTSFLVPKRSM